MDANLVNPWGIALNPAMGGFLVSDNGKYSATMYGGGVGGTPVTSAGQVVSIPGGVPTGQVFIGTSDFVISAGGASGPATLIFSSEAGQITAWNLTVNAGAAMSETTVPGPSYKGRAIGNSGTTNYLYATNSASSAIDVLDKNFSRPNLPGSFSDPGMPAGFAPFNIGTFSNALLVGNFGDGWINAFDPDTGASLGFVKNSAGNPLAIPGLWGPQFGNGVSAGNRNHLHFTAGPGSEQHGLFGRIEAVP